MPLNNETEPNQTKYHHFSSCVQQDDKDEQQIEFRVINAGEEFPWCNGESPVT